MEKVARFGVSVEAELLDRFDRIIRKEGYTNRSKAICDIIRKKLVETEWNEGEEDVVGTITIVYDHDVGNVTNRLLHIQHDFQDMISSTTHVHIDEHTCIEVLVVQGKAEKIRALADGIKTIRGVLYSQLVTTSKTIGVGLHHSHA